MRLLDHYLQLCRAFPHHNGLIRFDAILDCLRCSPRHTRQLLQQMGQQGWLVWRPGQGRGHPSHLQLLLAAELLEQDEVNRLLAVGELEQVLKRLPPQGRRQLAQWLPGHLGIVPQAPRTLRLPFYRPLYSLDPTQTHRRTESHLCRQLFDGLTRFDRTRAQVQPALAHHWTHNLAMTRWRFHLRPGVRFHHGRVMTSADVVHSLRMLRDRVGLHQGLLRHLVQAVAEDDLTLDIQLSMSDSLLLHRLANVAAAVLPMDCRERKDFAQFPVGTGAFRVTANSACRVTFQAFEQHWQCRPLLDTVEIWIVDDPEVMASLDARFHPADTPLSHTILRQLEAGCTYLATNPRRLAWKVRQQLASLLHPLHWQPEVTGIPAWGLLPQWRALPSPLSSEIALPERLHVLTYNNPSLLALTQAVKSRLEAAGCELSIEVLAYPELIGPAQLNRADLLLVGEVLGDDLDFSMYQWLFQDTFFTPWLTAEYRAACQEVARALAAEPDVARRWQGYEQVAQRLVESYALIPLRHEEQQLVLAPAVKGCSLTQCGLIDFAQVWLAPPTTAEGTV